MAQCFCADVICQLGQYIASCWLTPLFFHHQLTWNNRFVWIEQSIITWTIIYWCQNNWLVLTEQSVDIARTHSSSRRKKINNVWWTDVGPCLVGRWTLFADPVDIKQLRVFGFDSHYHYFLSCVYTVHRCYMSTRSRDSTPSITTRTINLYN